MKIEPLYTGITFVNEWMQIFQRHNWYTITPIKLEFESDKMAGDYGLNVIILGIGFEVRYWPDSERKKNLIKKAKEWEK